MAQSHSVEILQAGHFLLSASLTSHLGQQEDQVEVEEDVQQVELGGLCAVQVGAVGGEDVVEDDVEAGQDWLAVVVAVAEDLRQEDHQGGGH